VRYENMMFVPSEPVPELKPSKEQLERLARALYPIIVEYYRAQEKKDDKVL
jgi:hypothetical protein